LQHNFWGEKELRARTLISGFVIGIAILVLLVVWAAGSQLYIWDSLRPFEDASASLNTVTTVVVLLLSLGLCFISFRAYEKKPTSQFLLLSAAFGIFFLKFLIQTIDIFYSPGNFFSPAAKNVFDFFVMAALFASLLKR
jgi:magnesium-transporting ATPase (P-type)